MLMTDKTTLPSAPLQSDEEQVVRIAADGEVRSASYDSIKKRPWFWYSPHRLSLKLFAAVQLVALVGSLSPLCVFALFLFGIDVLYSGGLPERRELKGFGQLLSWLWLFVCYPIALSLCVRYRLVRLNKIVAALFFWASYTLVCAGVERITLGRNDIEIFAAFGAGAVLVGAFHSLRNMR